jgi:Integrase core domain
MRENAIQGAKRRGKPWRTTKPDPRAGRPADLVRRDFYAERPDQLWFADFTYLRCWEGLVFFSFAIDAYSRRIVGWQFAPHMRTTLVPDALRMALHQRQPGADVAAAWFFWIAGDQSRACGGLLRAQCSLCFRSGWQARSRLCAVDPLGPCARLDHRPRGSLSAEVMARETGSPAKRRPRVRGFLRVGRSIRACGGEEGPSKSP